MTDEGGHEGWGQWHTKRVGDVDMCGCSIGPIMHVNPTKPKVALTLSGKP